MKMTAEQTHTRARVLLVERSNLQREIRPKLERIREIERQLAECDARLAQLRETPERRSA